MLLLLIKMPNLIEKFRLGVRVKTQQIDGVFRGELGWIFLTLMEKIQWLGCLKQTSILSYTKSY